MTETEDRIISVPLDTRVINSRNIIIVFSAFVLAYVAIISFPNLEHNQMIALTDIIFIIANALATATFFYAAKVSIKPSRNRKAWFVLALGQLSFTFGDVFWAYYEINGWEVPIPSTSDIPYLLYYPLFIVGILLLPSPPMSRNERIRTLLDTGIVMIAGTIIFWNLLIGPTIAESVEGDIYSNAIAIAYPIMDLVLFFAVVELIFKRLRFDGQDYLILLAIGGVFGLISDTLFMNNMLRDSYVSGSLLDTAWLINYMFYSLAAIRYIEFNPATDIYYQTRYVKHVWPFYIPYLWVAAAFALLIWSHDHPQSLPFQSLGIGVGSMVGLVMVRQLITINENSKLFEDSIREIHERKQAEENVRRLNDELEKKVAEMERFIYTVSHDLRSPLITINGFAGFLEQDLNNPDHSKAMSDLKAINGAVDLMDQLLSETLELSRIGRVANPPVVIPFEEIVQDALRLTSEKVRSRGVEIIVASSLPLVNVDRMRIVEVMVNLIENSVKYIGDTLNPKIEIGYNSDARDAVFFVKDNGIGVDPSQHDKIFGLFYKIDKKSPGTGAGLAIVKRIIEVHGGQIWIESELGEGCTVCFTLPLSNSK